MNLQETQEKSIFDSLKKKYDEKTAKIVLQNKEVKEIIDDIVKINSSEIVGTKVSKNVYANHMSKLRRRKENLKKTIAKVIESIKPEEIGIVAQIEQQLDKLGKIKPKEKPIPKEKKEKTPRPAKGSPEAKAKMEKVRMGLKKYLCSDKKM